METIKEKIKELSDLQRVLKDQRKTVNRKGEAFVAKFIPYTYTCYSAQEQHAYNRNILRQLYAAYHILRGKDPLKIDSELYLAMNKAVINKLVDKYAEETIRIS